MIRKNLPWLLPLCVLAGLSLAGLGYSFYRADSTRRQLVGEVEAALQEFRAGRKGWTDEAGGPLGDFAPQDAEAYLPVVLERGDFLDDRLHRLRDGEGMFLWYLWNRESQANAYAAELADERRIASALKAALDALSPQRLRVEAVLLRSQQTASETTARFIPSSDEKDFETSITSLEQALAGLADEHARIVALRAHMASSSEQDGFSRALLAGFEGMLDEESRNAGRWVETCRTAHAALEEHKNATARSLDLSSGAIVWLDEVLAKTVPAIELAAGAARTGRKTVALLTPIRVLSPRVVSNLDAIDLLCRLVIAAEAEAQRVEGQIRPLADAMDAFATARERSSMLLILDRAPAALETLDTLSGALGLALAPLEKARAAVQDLAEIVPEVPGIPDLLGWTRKVLTATAKPFQDSKASLQESATALRDLQQREEEYRRRLDEVAADSA